MEQLHCNISSSLWQELQARAASTREPIESIVGRALHQYLQTGSRTLYQVSTAVALVEGVYDGVARIAELRERGDLGLGTFEGLDGEMVILDGRFYQVRCDGSVVEVGDNVLTPFAAITRFVANDCVTVANYSDFEQLQLFLDTQRRSDNVIYALRATGHFEHIRTRAVCPAKGGVKLLEAASIQPEFDFRDISGTLVGFWTPHYARSFNVPGYHLHFLSDDRSRGGHLLQCCGAKLYVQIQEQRQYCIALPETEQFLKADLRRDPAADLAQAEGGRK